MQDAANLFEKLREEGEVMGRKDENWKGWREEITCEDSVSNYLMGGRYVSGRTRAKIAKVEEAIGMAREKEMEKMRKEKENVGEMREVEEKQSENQLRRKVWQEKDSTRTKTAGQRIAYASQRQEKPGVSAEWKKCSKRISNERCAKIDENHNLAGTPPNPSGSSRSAFTISTSGSIPTPYSPIDPPEARQKNSTRLVADWLDKCDSAAEDDRSDNESLSSFIGGILRERPQLDVQIWRVLGSEEESTTATSTSYSRDESSVNGRRASRYTSPNSSITRGERSRIVESNSTKQTSNHQTYDDNCVYNRPYHIELDSYFRTMVRIRPKERGKGIWSGWAVKIGLGKKKKKKDEPAPKVRKRRRYRNPAVEMSGGRSEGARSDAEDRENEREIRQDREREDEANESNNLSTISSTTSLDSSRSSGTNLGSLFNQSTSPTRPRNPSYDNTARPRRKDSDYSFIPSPPKPLGGPAYSSQQHQAQSSKGKSLFASSPFSGSLGDALAQSLAERVEVQESGPFVGREDELREEHEVDRLL
ncbi:hypothetical protein B0J14DRAFT_668273 [Halenospora varia]|nr:hypothetical protein B0J14DRAFT_668273 [Halenospora varia]